MASLFTTVQALITLGAEDKRIDILERELGSIGDVIADVTRTLIENTPTTLWTLWQDVAQHGVATNPLVEPFKVGLLVVDPDGANAAGTAIDVEIGSTRHNSTTVDRVVRRVTREMPLLLSSSICSKTASDSTDLFAAIISATTNYDRITQIRARNFNAAASGANNVKTRLVLLK